MQENTTYYINLSTKNYHPFGMTMPGRSFNSPDYRFGFNGMEKDDEIKGNGNEYTTEFRQYDPRLGRWTSLGPLMAQFPHLSPFVAFDNNPIYFVDPYGLAPGNGDNKIKGKKKKKKKTNGSTNLNLITSWNTKKNKHSPSVTYRKFSQRSKTTGWFYTSNESKPKISITNDKEVTDKVETPEVPNEEVYVPVEDVTDPTDPRVSLLLIRGSKSYDKEGHGEQLDRIGNIASDDLKNKTTNVNIVLGPDAKKSINEQGIDIEDFVKQKLIENGFSEDIKYNVTDMKMKEIDKDASNSESVQIWMMDNNKKKLDEDDF